MFKDKIVKAVFWGVILRFILETYIELAIAFQINLSRLDEMETGSAHWIASLTCSIVAALIVFGAPFIISVLLVKNRAEILDERRKYRGNVKKYLVYTEEEREEALPFERKYGDLYDGLKAKNNG